MNETGLTAGQPMTDTPDPHFAPPARRATWWVIAVPTFLTLALGGAFLSRSSIWDDEAATWRNSRMPLSSIVHYTLHSQDAVFLPYYLLMHEWMALGTQAWLMRLPSLLAAGATTAFLCLLSRRWLGPGWVLLAGLLLALNPLFVRWSMEARPYAIATMFAVLSAGALLTAVERRDRRSWFLYGLYSLCMLLFHPFAALVLVAEVLALLLARPAALRGLVVTLLCVGVLVSPLAAVAAGQSAQVSWISPANIGTFGSAFTVIAGGHTPALALVLCAVAVLVVAVRRPAGGDERLHGLLVAAWAVVPALALVAVSFAHPLYVDRYLLVSVPGVALTEAMAAQWLWSVVQARRPAPIRSIVPVGAIGAVAVVVLVVAAPLWLARTSLHAARAPYYYDDFRSASSALRQDLADGVTGMLVVRWDAGFGFAYYSDNPGVQYRLLHPAGVAFPRVVTADAVAAPRQGQTGLVSLRRGVALASVVRSCASMVVIGRNPVSLTTFSLNGSACRLVGMQRFGLVWVARAQPTG